jgi:hypothetical protein
MFDKANFTLGSKVGKFTFEENTPMSHAKVVRDTVMANVMGCGEQRPVKNNHGAVELIRYNLEGPAKHTVFTWFPGMI